MIVDKNGYIKIQDKINEQVKGLISEDELESFNQHVESKLKNFKPTLMIYGVYNAGKSTLLNALFGKEEMAKTGDAPETNKIKAYTYNGYTIFDTPGLNAKEEDDNTTQKHLEKSELVLFVMSNNGSLEEEYVYEKISEVVQAKKPIIIILNNKSGIDMKSVESILLMNKVGENLRKIGDRNNIENIEDKVSIYQVNAKSALKGKIEHKNIILNKSNIIQLENKIENILEKAGQKEVITALNQYIVKFIDRIIKKIDIEIDNVEVQKTEELITFLEKFKKSSEIKLKNTVDNKMPTFIETLTTKIYKEDDDINSYIEVTIESIVSEIVKNIKFIEKELATKIDNFVKEIDELHPEYIGVGSIDSAHSKKSDNADSLIPDEAKAEITNTVKNKKVIEEGTKIVLTKAKEWLPKDVMYGKGPVWISKTAGRVAIGVTIAMEAYGAYNAYNEHKKEIEEQRNRVISAKNSAESIAHDIQNSLYARIDEVIAELFNDMIINYKKLSNQLNVNNKKLVNKKDELISILNQL